MDISGTWQSPSLPKNSILGDKLVLAEDGRFIEIRSSDGRRRIGRWHFEEESKRLGLDYESDGLWPYFLPICTEHTLELALDV